MTFYGEIESPGSRVIHKISVLSNDFSLILHCFTRLVLSVNSCYNEKLLCVNAVS